MRYPQKVLVETLTEVCRVLPRTDEGARPTMADTFKKLPAVFSAWYALKLEPKARSLGGQGVQREAKTLAEIADALLVGDPMRASIVAVQRLKALSQSLSQDQGGWAVARHHELVDQDELGLLTNADRRRAVRDQKELAGLVYSNSDWKGGGKGKEQGGKDKGRKRGTS